MRNKGLTIGNEKSMKEDVKFKKELSSKYGLFMNLSLDDGEDVDFIFLTNEAISCYEHTLGEGKSYSTQFCSNGSSNTGDCEYCKEGIKKMYRSHFLVLQLTPTQYRKKDGTLQVNQNCIRLWKRPTTDVTRINNISRKRGGTEGYIFNVVRTGTNQSTTYDYQCLERYDDDLIDELTDDILEVLPEGLRLVLEEHGINEQTLTTLLAYDITKDETILEDEGISIDMLNTHNKGTNKSSTADKGLYNGGRRSRNQRINNDDEEEYKPRKRRTGASTKKKRTIRRK